MKKVLIVFDYNPDEIKYFGVEVTDGEIEILKDAHGKYINCDDDVDSVNWIRDATCDDPECCEIQGAEHNCKWGNFQIKINKGELVDISNFDLLIHCGFVY